MIQDPSQTSPHFRVLSVWVKRLTGNDLSKGLTWLNIVWYQKTTKLGRCLATVQHTVGMWTNVRLNLLQQHNNKTMTTCRVQGAWHLGSLLWHRSLHEPCLAKTAFYRWSQYISQYQIYKLVGKGLESKRKHRIELTLNIMYIAFDHWHVEVRGSSNSCSWWRSLPLKCPTYWSHATVTAWEVPCFCN